MAEHLCTQKTSSRTDWRPERAEGAASKRHHGGPSYLMTMICFFKNLSSKSVNKKKLRESSNDGVGVADERIVLSFFMSFIKNLC